MDDFDRVLKELGQFGKYQVVTYILLFVPLATFSISSLTYVFTTADPDYRCAIPECENGAQIYEQPWLQNAIPFKKDGSIEHCLRYRKSLNYSRAACSSGAFSQEPQACESYVFGKYSESSFTKDFNLLCETNDWKKSLVGTVGNLAMLLGMPIAGLFSDRLGRKTLIAWGVLLTGIFGIVNSFTSTYTKYIICEAFRAFCHAGLFHAAFVLGSEIVGPDRRGLGGALISVYFTIGEVILGAITWLFNDWHTYLKVLYIPILIIGVLCNRNLPESVRWTIVNRQKEKANESIHKMARWNKKTLSMSVQNSIERESTENEVSREDKTTLVEVFKSKRMMLRLISMAYCGFSVSVIFYGLSLYSGNIGGHQYFKFIMVSCLELPGILIFYLLVNRGRKLCLSLGFLISAAASLAIHFTRQGSAISLITFFIGKLAISVASAAVSILTVELFPTNFRNTMFGFVGAIGVIGALVAPHVHLIAKLVDPVIIFTVLGITASVTGLFFPETRKCAMPDSLKAAEDMGKRT